MIVPDYRDYHNDLSSYLQALIDAGLAAGKGAAHKIAETKIPLESRIQSDVMTRLKDLRKSGRLDPDAVFYKQAAGPYGVGGLPDITLIARSRENESIPAAHIGLEVKRPLIGELTPLQRRTIQQLYKAGALVYVVHSADEAEHDLHGAGFLTEG